MHRQVAEVWRATGAGIRAAYYVSIRQRTSAYVSIRQHTWGAPSSRRGVAWHRHRDSSSRHIPTTCISRCTRHSFYSVYLLYWYQSTNADAVSMYIQPVIGTVRPVTLIPHVITCSAGTKVQMLTDYVCIQPVLGILRPVPLMPHVITLYWYQSTNAALSMYSTCTRDSPPSPTHATRN